MKTHFESLESIKKIAQLVVSEAREITMPYYGTHLPVMTKSDASPVTEADRRTEQCMRTVIEQHYPQHGIYGEEFGAVRTDASSVWVIDPIDGTKSFMTGNPLWGTLVAYCEAGRPNIGVIDMPALDQRWVASQGQGAFCNGVQKHVKPCDDLSLARFQTTSPDAFTLQEWQLVDAISQRCAWRRFGGDCFIYTQLASGHLDVVIEGGLQPYDYLALVNVVEEAGGCITDWQGQALSLSTTSGQVLATASPQLHAQVLALLAS